MLARTGPSQVPFLISLHLLRICSGPHVRYTELADRRARDFSRCGRVTYNSHPTSWEVDARPDPARPNRPTALRLLYGQKRRSTDGIFLSSPYVTYKVTLQHAGFFCFPPRNLACRSLVSYHSRSSFACWPARNNPQVTIYTYTHVSHGPTLLMVNTSSRSEF